MFIKGEVEKAYVALISKCSVHYFRLDLDAWINDPPSDSSDDDDRKISTSIFLPPAKDDHRY